MINQQAQSRFKHKLCGLTLSPNFLLALKEILKLSLMVYTFSSGTQWAETGRSLFVDVSLIYIEYFRITRTIGRLHLKKCHLRSSCEMNYVILRQLLVWWKQNPCCKFWECVGLRLRKKELRWLQSKCYISLSKHYSLAAVDILNKHKSAKPEYVLVALSES